MAEFKKRETSLKRRLRRRRKPKLRKPGERIGRPVGRGQALRPSPVVPNDPRLKKVHEKTGSILDVVRAGRRIQGKPRRPTPRVRPLKPREGIGRPVGPGQALKPRGIARGIGGGGSFGRPRRPTKPTRKYKATTPSRYRVVRRKSGTLKKYQARRRRR